MDGFWNLVFFSEISFAAGLIAAGAVLLIAPKWIRYAIALAMIGAGIAQLLPDWNTGLDVPQLGE